MASLTIRNIPEETKRRFRLRAAKHGHSMEEEARQLLIDSVGENPATASIREEPQGFDHRQGPGRSEAGDDWVQELIRLARGAGEGVFDREPQPLREFDL